MADPTAPVGASQPSQFDLMRRRVLQQTNAATQTNQDATARQFAARGMGGSGAAIKQSENVAQAGQSAQNDALAGVDAQEAQQKYTEGEAQKQRDFATSERVASQGYQSGEAQTQRLFSQDLFDKDLAFKNQVENNSNFFKQLDANQSESANRANLALGLGNLDFNNKDAQNLFTQANTFLGPKQSTQLPAMSRRIG